MSFASRAREEIAQRSLQKDCCVRAAAYGFACFAKYFDKGGLVLQTEQPHTVQLARELFAVCTAAVRQGGQKPADHCGGMYRRQAPFHYICA